MPSIVISYRFIKGGSIHQRRRPRRWSLAATHSLGDCPTPLTPLTLRSTTLLPAIKVIPMIKTLFKTVNYERCHVAAGCYGNTGCLINVSFALFLLSTFARSQRRDEQVNKSPR